MSSQSMSSKKRARDEEEGHEDIVSHILHDEEDLEMDEDRPRRISREYKHKSDRNDPREHSKGGSRVEKSERLDYQKGAQNPPRYEKEIHEHGRLGPADNGERHSGHSRHGYEKDRQERPERYDKERDRVEHDKSEHVERIDRYESSKFTQSKEHLERDKFRETGHHYESERANVSRYDSREKFPDSHDKFDRNVRDRDHRFADPDRDRPKHPRELETPREKPAFDTHPSSYGEGSYRHSRNESVEHDRGYERYSREEIDSHRKESEPSRKRPKVSEALPEHANPNLFINYLPFELDEDGLTKLFSKFGKIQSTKIMFDMHTRHSRGFGFVRFYSWESAERAIREMNGKSLSERPLLVKYAEDSGVPPSLGNPSENVYVKGLPYSYREKDVNELFDSCGRILFSKIVKDRTNGTRGQAFVRFDRIAAAQRAIDELNGHEIKDGKPLKVRYADPEEERIHYTEILHTSEFQRYVPRPPSPERYPAHYGSLHRPVYHTNDESNLYVYPLPPNAEDTLLYRLFGPFGAIVSVKIVRDFGTNECKGYGFVQMGSWKEAARAIEGLSGTKIDGRLLHVSHKK